MKTECNHIAAEQTRTSLLPLAAAAATICLWSAGAHAQINPFRGHGGPTLSKADLQQGMQAVDKLLKEDEGKVGATEKWTGPTSGNSGIMTVQNAFERKGLTCRALKSEVDYKTGKKRTWNLNVCRMPSGDWKIV